MAYIYTRCSISAYINCILLTIKKHEMNELEKELGYELVQKVLEKIPIELKSREMILIPHKGNRQDYHFVGAENVIKEFIDIDTYKEKDFIRVQGIIKIKDIDELYNISNKKALLEILSNPKSVWTITNDEYFYYIEIWNYKLYY